MRLISTFILFAIVTASADDDAVVRAIGSGQSNNIARDGGGGDMEPHAAVRIHNKAEPVGERMQTWDLSKVQFSVPSLNGGTPFSAGNNNPTFHFAKRIAIDLNKRVEVVMNSEGAQPIESWVTGPNGGPFAFNGPLAVDLITQLESAWPAASGQTADVFIWQGGESNGSQAGSASPLTHLQYQLKFEFMVSALRALPQIDEQTIIICGSIAEQGTGREEANKFFERIESGAAGVWTIPAIKFADFRHIPVLADLVHFTGPSLVRIGREFYFRAYLGSSD